MTTTEAPDIAGQRRELQERQEQLKEERRGLSVPCARGDAAAKQQVAEFSRAISDLDGELELLELAEAELRREAEAERARRVAAAREQLQEHQRERQAAWRVGLADIVRLTEQLRAAFIALGPLSSDLDLIEARLTGSLPMVPHAQQGQVQFLDALQAALTAAGYRLCQ